jgi:hypothetical protein
MAGEYLLGYTDPTFTMRSTQGARSGGGARETFTRGLGRTIQEALTTYSRPRV